MKKIKIRINNVYRIIQANSGKEGPIIRLKETMEQEPVYEPADDQIRNRIQGDRLFLEADPAIRENLKVRVKAKDPRARLTENSSVGLLMPFFTGKHFEIKMALVTAGLVITLGIGNVNRHVPDKSQNFFFLTDTLTDSSVYQLPALPDTAGLLPAR